jgi:hypothetical protein
VVHSESRRPTMRLLLCCAVLCCALPVLVSADIPQPRPAPTPRPLDWSSLKLVVENTPNGREAELWLPQEYNPQTMGATDSGGLSSPGTIVSGAALSLGLALGGIWLARSRRRIGTTGVTAGVAVLAVLAGTAGYAVANMAPPRPLDPGSLKIALPGGDALEGKVRVRYSSESGVVRLKLPAPKPEEKRGHGE